MIFIGADRRIVGIVENAEPQTLTERRVPGLSLYVLEIGGGVSGRMGIRPGQMVVFQGVPAPSPRRLMRPMLAMLADAPLSDPNLVYEPKYDGIRALVAVTPPASGGAADVRISSRAGNDKTVQFPEVVLALSRWGATLGGAALLDGELVALDADGQPSGFQRIQDRIHLSGHRGDRPARRREPDRVCGVRPAARRRTRHLRAAAQRAAAAAGGCTCAGAGRAVRIATQVRGDGAALLAEAQARGWEGLVVKDARSPYRPGRRTREWRSSSW